MLHIKKAKVTREFNGLYQLRYQVLCQEKGLLNPEDYPDHKEKDAFDSFAVHFIAQDESDQIIGTVRLILDSHTPDGLPIIDHPGLYNKDFSTLWCAEVSRLAVKKDCHEMKVYLGLFRAIYHYCETLRISSFMLNIEPEYFYFLEKMGFLLEPLGKPDQHLGYVTIPVRWNLSDAAGSLRLRNPSVYDWLRNDPTLVPDNDNLFISEKIASYSIDNHTVTIARG